MRTIIFTILMLTCVFSAAQNVSAQNKEKPATVQSVDLNKYAGVWYEIARYPDKFQEQCSSDVTTEYILEKEGDFAVINKCKNDKGAVDDVKGKMRVVDKKTNAVLQIRFSSKRLLFLPKDWQDYWILDLGKDYDYALVGSPDRKVLYVLSRTPQFDGEKYESIMQIAKQQGFIPDKLIKTRQTAVSSQPSAVSNQ